MNGLSLSFLSFHSFNFVLRVNIIVLFYYLRISVYPRCTSMFEGFYIFFFLLESFLVFFDFLLFFFLVIFCQITLFVSDLSDIYSVYIISYRAKPPCFSSSRKKASDIILTDVEKTNITQKNKYHAKKQISRLCWCVYSHVSINITKLF